jgi:hypothetical protein
MLFDSELRAVAFDKFTGKPGDWTITSEDRSSGSVPEDRSSGSVPEDRSSGSVPEDQATPEEELPYNDLGRTLAGELTKVGILVMTCDEFGCGPLETER